MDLAWDHPLRMSRSRPGQDAFYSASLLLLLLLN